MQGRYRYYNVESSDHRLVSCVYTDGVTRKGCTSVGTTRRQVKGGRGSVCGRVGALSIASLKAKLFYAVFGGPA